MCLLDINLYIFWQFASGTAKEQRTAFQKGEIGTDSTCDTAALSLTDIQWIGLNSNINIIINNNSNENWNMYKSETSIIKTELSMLCRIQIL